MAADWPDFFLTGPGRSGTTSLYRYMAKHPEIFLPEEKEHRFFDGTLGQASELAVEAGEQEYLSHFEPAEPDQVVGEGTVSYVYHRDALERIHEVRPDAKFIVSYRDPVERAYSLYELMVSAGKESRAFPDAIDQAIDHDEQGWETERVKYIRNGRQGTQLERLHDIFGEDQVLVVLFEDIKQDTKSVLEEIARFLDVDVDEMRKIDTERAHNTSPGLPPNALARKLRSSKFVKSAAQLLLPERVRDYLGNEVLLEDVQRPPMDPNVRRRLAILFEPEVAKAEKLLERDLPELRRTWPEEYGGQAE